MKLSPLCPPRHRLVLAAAGFGLALLAAPVAQAFTFEDLGGGTGDSASRYAAPETPHSRFGTIGSPTGPAIRQGNTTLQFGGTQPRGSFHQRYNSDRLFDPIAPYR
ncbi:MAG: hypothetical protein Q8M26_04615 [Pseudolabrys sp.]|nr:hypothetical protein [Pseudolabrys sp.]